MLPAYSAISVLLIISLLYNQQISLKLHLLPHTNALPLELRMKLKKTKITSELDTIESLPFDVKQICSDNWTAIYSHTVVGLV